MSTGLPFQSQIGNFNTDPRGNAQSAVTLGVVTKSAIPTSNPHVANQLYSNSGVVTVSSG